jgi:hypothetical protein
MSPEDRHKYVMKNKDDPELLIALLQARGPHSQKPEANRPATRPNCIDSGEGLPNRAP